MNKFMDKKIKALVTGGAGFIGSNLVNRLIGLGHEVVVIDNKSSENFNIKNINKSATYFNLDIQDFDSTKKLYKDVDYVFHMAAESKIQLCINNPISAFNTNALGTSVVLQCSKELGVKRVVYSSTSAIYGKNSIPNIETQIDDPLNPYSVSKLSAEKISKMYYDLYGLETISLRYFNVYGNNQPTKGQYAPVLGVFLDQKHNDKSLTITGDGSQKRDMVHVDDIIKANILAATSDIDSKYFGTVFNVGTGKSYSIKEMADMISDNQTFIPKRPGEAKETLANINKISSILGWKPTINLEDYLKVKGKNTNE